MGSSEKSSTEDSGGGSGDSRPNNDGQLRSGQVLTWQSGLTARHQHLPRPRQGEGVDVANLMHLSSCTWTGQLEPGLYHLAFSHFDAMLEGD